MFDIALSGGIAPDPDVADDMLSPIIAVSYEFINSRFIF